MFGFSADEAVGRSITMIIPDERLPEESEILRRLRAGERIEHFETVRRRKDGDLIDISLTVSPVRSAAGDILGASKIARAHALTMPEFSDDASGTSATTFVALLVAVLAPRASDGTLRFAISGSDASLSGNALTSAALLLHELATNAAKYGALSVPEGRLSVELSTEGDSLRVQWRETGVPNAPSGSRGEGFGSTLERAALAGLQGKLTRDWQPDGLSIVLELPLARLTG